MNSLRGFTLWLHLASLLAAFGAARVTASDAKERPAALYEEWRKSPAPADGAVVPSNPPSLLWASVKYWESRDVRYRVALSDDASFPPNRTQRGPEQRTCFFNPHGRLKPGTWYWRYEVLDGPNATTKGPYSFQVRDATPVFETPTFEVFLAGIPKTHPRVVSLGQDLAGIRRSARSHPLTAEILRLGRKAAAANVYSGPVTDSDPARARALNRRGGQELKAFHQLVDAHVLSGDPALLAAILLRIDVLLGWPTNDLIGSQVLTALAKAYDALYDELAPAVRSRMLEVIARQLHDGLAAWPGKIEGRQVENHFWQMELSGNFSAALSTVHELEAGRAMLEYTYELFLARFPNLSTRDGGWAEGLGYFGVNKSAIVDMALLLKKVGRVDVFQLEWYRSLADYFIYFAPFDGRIDGFGDMHDRVGNGNLGHAMMFVVGQENRDARALYRAAGQAGSAETVEPWYRIVHNITFDPARVTPPVGLPQARLFPGVGLAALHTEVLESARDTAVYFRSSPFGAKGHMHANQNAFNLSRRGEPLFYSTGYYTSFADPHSLSSYRHTRAHNAILVNGCGQAFGHEGYGWIKRYAHSREISYVCGDATMAYRPTVDRQFLDLLAESKIPLTREHGHGDGRLRLFERHVLLVRPDTVIVYDILEAQEPSDWTLLLHTMRTPALAALPQTVRLDTEKNSVDARVAGSQPLTARLTDQFFSPPIDVLNKYRETPNQYHLSFATRERSRGMRFLTVIQLADAGAAPPAIVEHDRGAFTVGGTHVRAELDPARPAVLSVETATAGLYINAWPAVSLQTKLPTVNGPGTVLVEKQAGKTTVQTAINLEPSF